MIIGKNGVEKVVEVPLTGDDKAAFEHSVEAVKELSALAVKLRDEADA